MEVNNQFLLLIIITSNFLSISSAFDPMPSRDICVADLTNNLIINGALPCKDPKTAKSDDFFFSGLAHRGNTNKTGIALSKVDVSVVPGVNTLGLTVARLDFGPGGIFPIHIHQRATEGHFVLEGVLEVGFVTTNPDYKLYNKTLYAGELFFVPPGTVHYQRNGWNGSTSELAMLNSQNPGLNSITHAVFGAEPKIDSDYLGKEYQLDEKIIEYLQKQRWV